MNFGSSQLSFDTASLVSRQTSQLVISKKNFAEFFTDRIYETCNDVHPLLAIEFEAVKLIQSLLEAIIRELLEYKPSSVLEVDRLAKRLFPEPLSAVLKEGWDNAHKSKHQKSPKNITENQMKLTAIIRDSLGIKDKDRRDRDKKEIEKIANYIYYTCESLIEDILRHTGKFVKNLRNDDVKITHQNLDVALSADRALQELRNRLKNETEAESPSAVPLSEFNDYLSEQTEGVSKPKQTYEAVAKEMLREERKFIRELNRINIFRRRMESVDEDRKYAQMLFANLTDIYELALKVERTLEDAIELSDTPCIGMGMWDLAEACEFNAYSTFLIRTDEESENMFAREVINMAIESILRNERFLELFQTEDRCFNSSLDGQSFRLAVQYVLPELLLVPLSHFYQFMDYINKLKMLTSSEDDRLDLHNCLSSLNNVRQVIECLERKTMTFFEQYNGNENIYNVQKLHEIQSTIESFTGSPIGKTCADMMKEGELSIVRPSLSLSPDVTKNKKWRTERYVYLFDQLLLMCKKHKSTTKFKDRMPVHMIDVCDIPDNEIPGIFHAFQLLFRDKSHVPSTYICMCKTSEEKKAWMAVLVLVTTKSILDRILDTYEKEEAKRIPLIIPSPDQYRFAEPDSEENILFEDYTSSSGIPVIKNGTVLKLVERLTYHSYTDSKYQQTFLISYRSFCTPNELLYLLLERFNIPTPHRLQHNHDKRGGPLAGRYDTVQSHGLSATSTFSPLHEQSFQRFRKEYERPVQLRVLSVINQWVKAHWYDFECDPALLESLEQFLQKICDPREKYTKQHKKFCKTILSTLEKRRTILEQENNDRIDEHEGHVNGAFVYGEEGTLPPPYANNAPAPSSFAPKRPEPLWHTAQKGDVDAYDLLTLHPLEIGRQLTLLHFDLYRAIKPIELVEAAWTKHDKYRKSPQLLKLTDHSTLLTYWVSKSIVETESLEERVAMFSRALEVMSVFEELHNFTGLVAFLSALRSACVHRLTWCWERLDNEKIKCFDRFVTLCEPRWVEMQKRLSNINPPCIPFFGHYLTNIYFFEAGNSTFVNTPTAKSKEAQRTESAVDKKMLVSFLKCRRISDLIREIQMYQNEPYPLQLEPSIRQFFESINPKSEFKNNDALETYLYEKSLEIQPKDTERPANEVKPKHSQFALRSPGVKPPKASSNHYTVGHQGPSAATTSAHASPAPMRVQSHHSSDDQNTAPHGGMSETMRARRAQNHVIPPPLFPRSRANANNNTPPSVSAPMPPTSASSRTSPAAFSLATSPLFGPAPELPPKRSNANSISPLAKSPLTPSSKNKNFQSHFQFPSVPEHQPMMAAGSSPPLLPPRPSTSSGSDGSSPNQKENAEQLRVVYGQPEAHSPTVALSVPLPPALPPPRGTNTMRTPPPRPPKSKALLSSSNEGASGGLGSAPSCVAPINPDPVSPSTFVNLPNNDLTTPPPLPPKTRRVRKLE